MVRFYSAKGNTSRNKPRHGSPHNHAVAARMGEIEDLEQNLMV